MTAITNELIYEVLKKLQSDVGDIKAALIEQGRQLIRIREDINNLRGDDLRHEGLQAQMDVRLQRIEARLNLSEG